MEKTPVQSGRNGAKNFEIMVPLQYLSNSWRTLEMSLITCEINLMLTWSVNCIMSSNTDVNQATTLEITNTKHLKYLMYLKFG